MYDGTVTLADPNLVESFELDEQTTAYVLRDYDAPAPDWDGIGYVYSLSYDHDRYDAVICAGDGSDSSPIPVDTLREAWDRFKDGELVARYFRMFHGAVSVDYSEGLDRNARVYAIVTRSQAEAWGTEDRADTLATEAIETVGAWFEGAVYGVIVVNSETGEEESVWGVYDSTPGLTYCRETAVDIAPIGVSA